jgi:hypothetical protein
VAAGPGRFIPGRARCSCVPAVPAIQVGWLIPEGVSRLWRLGCGADVEISSPVARGRGACERDTQVSQLVESPAWPCVLLDRSKDLSLFHVSPSILATGVSFTRSHRFFSSKGLLYLYGRDRRPIRTTGCPRYHLQRTLQTHSDNALSLMVYL